MNAKDDRETSSSEKRVKLNKYELDRAPLEEAKRVPSTGLYRTPSFEQLNVIVPNCVDSSYSSPRKVHSSPIRNINHRRRYSQGAVLIEKRFSVLDGDIVPLSELLQTSVSLENTVLEDGKYLRHSSENLRDLNKFPPLQFLAQEPKDYSPSSRLRSCNKVFKRHYDQITGLDDIVESPLVKTPNNAHNWFLPDDRNSADTHLPSSSDRR